MSDTNNKLPTTLCPSPPSPPTINLNNTTSTLIVNTDNISSVISTLLNSKSCGT